MTHRYFTEETALHEAAHAVVADARGIPVDGVSMHADGGGTWAAAGEGWDYGMVALAGAACSWLFLTEFLGWSPRRARRVMDQTCSGDYELFAEAMGHPPEGDDWDDALELVVEQWDAIITLGDELLESPDGVIGEVPV